MTLFLIAFIAIIGIFFGKLIFKYWFNHISIYSFVWGGMIFLYQLKLLNYIDITPEAWFVIAVSYLLFIIGSLTPLFVYKKDASLIRKTTNGFDLLFLDGGKIFLSFLYAITILCLIGAIWNWYMLFTIYGSFVKIFMSANDIYHLRVESEIPGLIPYIGGFGYAGLILAGIYTAHKGKISLVTIILFISVILRDMSNFARVGILISFVVYISSLFLYKNFSNKAFSKNKSKIILIILVSIILIVVSASVVRLFRGSYETYKGSKSELSEFKGNLIISPSIYLYFSAHIGVFSKYLDLESEHTRFGENTFQPAYNLLAKFHLTDKVSFYQKGYYIPMWTNSSTYLRELHSDFGYLGLFLGPYLLAFITSIFWIRFYRSGNIYDFNILTILIAFVSMSFFSMIIRSPDSYFALLILFIILPLIKRSAAKNSLITE